MSSKVTRRGAMLASALTLGGGHAVMAGKPQYETDSVTQGIIVRLGWGKGWEVLVPDHEYVQNRLDSDGYFVPGMTIPWRRIPLDAYLAAAQEDFKLTPPGHGYFAKHSGPPCCRESRFQCINETTVACDTCGKLYHAEA